MTNQCTKFDISSFSPSRDILGRLKIKNGSCVVITCLSGTVHHLQTGTCYD